MPNERMTVNGIELEVLRRGAGTPLLLLHGMDTVPPQARFLDRLGRDAEIIAPSSPGFGNTKRPTDFDTVYDLVHLYLAVLDDTTDEVMYYPPAFSPGSREVLRRLFPDALIAGAEDAAAFGLNAVSDGLHVLLPQAATGLLGPLRERGFEPVGIDLSELLKGGGSVKCCTQELRC